MDNYDLYLAQQAKKKNKRVFLEMGYLDYISIPLLNSSSYGRRITIHWYGKYVQNQSGYYSGWVNIRNHVSMNNSVQTLYLRASNAASYYQFTPSFDFNVMNDNSFIYYNNVPVEGAPNSQYAYGVQVIVPGDQTYTRATTISPSQNRNAPIILGGGIITNGFTLEDYDPETGQTTLYDYYGHPSGVFMRSDGQEILYNRENTNNDYALPVFTP